MEGTGRKYEATGYKSQNARLGGSLNVGLIRAARMVGGDDSSLINEHALRMAGKIRQKDSLTLYDVYMAAMLALVVGIAVGYAWHFMQR